MPIIGRQCTRDGRTVCLRMSQTSLPVNQEGPGLTLVYGWASEDRRAQGIPASVQGIELCTPGGRILAFDYCPFCGEKIGGSSTSVRMHGVRRPSPEAEAAPVVERRPAERLTPVAPPAPAAAQTPAHADAATASLKIIRERLGLSQAELGEKLGLARSSVANYENGRSPLSQRLRKWIAKHEGKLTDSEAPSGRSSAAA